MAILKADAVKAVLQDLQVLDRVGTVDTKDSTLVGLRFDNAVALFTARDGVTINTSDIHAALFPHLVAWLVEDCKPAFYKEPSREAQAAAETALLGTARSLAAAQSSVDGRLETAVLRALGVLGPAENPTAMDLAIVSGRLSDLLADLSNRNIITISGAGSIPANAFDALTLYVTETLRPVVTGKPASDAIVAEALQWLRNVARSALSVGGTLADKLAAEALRALGALKAGEAPSTKDAAFISVRLEEALDDLARRDVIAITNAAAIAAEHFDGLLAYIVELIAPKFGRATNADALQAAEGRLRTIARRGYSVGGGLSDKLVAEVLRAHKAIGPNEAPSTDDAAMITARLTEALADLYTRNIVAISASGDLTTDLFDGLAAYVAELVAPKLGRPASADALAAAEARLRTVTRFKATAPSSTSDKFGAAVLRSLNLLRPGENPTAQDLGFVSRRMAGILADLSTRDVVTVANQAAITDALFEALVSFTAETLAPEIADRATNAEAKGAAEAWLRRIARETTAAPSDTVVNRIAVQVLRELGVISQTGNPSTKELAGVTAQIDRAVSYFAAADLATFANAAAITDAYVVPVAAWVAEEYGPRLGRKSDPAAKAVAEEAIRTLNREGLTVDDTATNRLAVRVLRAMGVIGRTAYPSTKELAAITDRIEGALLELSSSRIISLSDADDAEGVGAMDALTIYLAWMLSPEAGTPQPAGRSGRAPLPTAAQAAQAEARLRRLGADRPTYLPLAVSYF